jgi:ArsR family transcriptional regulator, virulence genes transcriptional regulator
MQQTARKSAADLLLRGPKIAEAAHALKAMASETRLMILCALGEGELPVFRLAELTGQSQSAVSQHLSKLRAANLVTSRREGQTIYYRCATGLPEQLIDTLCRFYEGAGNAADQT